MAQQVGMSMAEFQKRFPDEEACRDYLFMLRWSNGFVCPRCQGRTYWSLPKRLLYECKGCRYQVSATAGSVLHRTRTSLLTWFWALFLISSDKRGHSALSLSKEMGISYWVSWTMLQKIRTAMGQQDDKYKLQGLVEMDEAYFGGERKGGKRGRGTTKSKVLVGVSTPDEKRSAGFVKMKLVRTFDEVTVRMFITNHIESGCTIQTDGLNIYSGLENLAKEHQSFVVSKGAESLRWINTIIGNAKTFLLGTYHGRPDPKHLQEYLNEYCYRVNRRFWESQLFPRIVAACANCEPTTYSELTQ